MFYIGKENLISKILKGNNEIPVKNITPGPHDTKRNKMLISQIEGERAEQWLSSY